MELGQNRIPVRVPRPFECQYGLLAENEAVAGNGEESTVSSTVPHCHNKHFPSASAKRRIGVDLMNQRLGNRAFQGILSAQLKNLWEDVDIDLTEN